MTGKIGEFPLWKAPSLADFEAMAAESYSRLPAHFRSLCTDLIIRIDDFPSEDVADQMKVRPEFDLLGLFQGIGLPYSSEPATGQFPNMIWLTAALFSTTGPNTTRPSVPS
jgi:predicted Zn-dependent protease with MMP-like domain